MPSEGIGISAFVAVDFFAVDLDAALFDQPSGLAF